MTSAPQYFMIDMPLLRQLRMVTGVRQEMSDQSVTSFNPYDVITSRTSPAAASRQKVVDWLPALNLTYALNEETNFRSPTARPSIAPTSVSSAASPTPKVVRRRPSTGSPDLVRAKIDNYDTRRRVVPDAQ
ncbi:MAG: hypothetical protein R3E12_15925 [Candidatus Eisenbacteria bacterium]